MNKTRKQCSCCYKEFDRLLFQNFCDDCDKLVKIEYDKMEKDLKTCRTCFWSNDECSVCYATKWEFSTRRNETCFRWQPCYLKKEFSQDIYFVENWILTVHGNSIENLRDEIQKTLKSKEWSSKTIEKTGKINEYILKKTYDHIYWVAKNILTGQYYKNDSSLTNNRKSAKKLSLSEVRNLGGAWFPEVYEWFLQGKILKD